MVKVCEGEISVFTAEGEHDQMQTVTASSISYCMEFWPTTTSYDLWLAPPAHNVQHSIVLEYCEWVVES